MLSKKVSEKHNTEEKYKDTFAEIVRKAFAKTRDFGE